ncbi:hypothetical protein JTB14_010111 [Gonioctena quinquepunctata]|nr:hypothetical protein JTB14_010111 [Gonioctena quinquepunctata]
MSSRSRKILQLAKLTSKANIQLRDIENEFTTPSNIDNGDGGSFPSQIDYGNGSNLPPPIDNGNASLPSLFHNRGCTYFPPLIENENASLPALIDNGNGIDVDILKIGTFIIDENGALIQILSEIEES